MSLWRKEASERLPELQRIIASKVVDNPMMLWIELRLEFERRCEVQPPPLDLLRRIWGYCSWCLEHGSDDVGTAAALAFGEHLMDTPAQIAILPEIMTRGEFLGLWALLEYHNTREEVDACLRAFKGSCSKSVIPPTGGRH